MKQIPKEALDFLEELKSNNDRDWFDEHKPKFKALEKEMKDFYKEVEILLNTHDKIQKTKAFRIYRDVRFSKDKTPYKSHFAASFTRKKPELRGGYYLHIKPNDQSFIAVGFWNPDKKDLKRIRKELLVDSQEVREIIAQKDLKKHWGELQGNALKTAPRGFDKEHPDIDLINFKQWTFSHTFNDKEVLAPDFAETVSAYYKAIRPFFDYMGNVLTTDLNGVSLLD